jgi:hypothetical protein
MQIFVALIQIDAIGHYNLFVFRSENFHFGMLGK